MVRLSGTGRSYFVPRRPMLPLNAAYAASTQLDTLRGRRRCATRPGANVGFAALRVVRVAIPHVIGQNPTSSPGSRMCAGGWTAYISSVTGVPAG